MTKKEQIQLTKEQKRCVEYPLTTQALIIDADPGTGKTEILRHRVKFIHQQNERQRKFILVVAVGRNISRTIKKKLREEGLKKVHDRLRKILPEFSLSHEICGQVCCLEKKKPVILACTVHSLAYWTNRQIFNKLFSEKKKIKILTNAQSKELSLIYQNREYEQLKEKVQWTTKEIFHRKRTIFNYLLRKVTSEKLAKEIKRELWTIFKKEVQISHEASPYYHWNIENYSEFLISAKKVFLENNLTCFSELENACQWDEENNIWMSFDDMIENVLVFSQETDIQVTWPNFDYILVDECQDLKKNLLRLITDIFSHKKTTFTFVGDPKQHIMAFAGATDDIFTLLAERFIDFEKMEIAISFRVPQEIAAVANDFTSRFMPYKPKLTTNKSNGNKKPIIFIAGKREDYKLTQEEENELKDKAQQIITEEPSNLELPVAKKEQKVKKLYKKLTDKQIRNKRLEAQMNFILSRINELDKITSRAILFRKNETGNWIKNWLIETNYYDFVTTAEDFNRAIIHIINKIKKTIRNESLLVHKFYSIEDFLHSLSINWHSIPRFQQLIEAFDQEKILDEEREEQSLSEDEVNDFILQIEQQLITKDTENTGKLILSTIHRAKGLEFDHVFLIAVDEGILPNETTKKEAYWVREEVNLFYTAITRAKKELYLTTSSKEECSRFIRNLDPKLFDWKFNYKNGSNEQETPPPLGDGYNYQHLISSCSSISEVIGERGEIEALEMLLDNQKIKFEKVVRSWTEIDYLEVDIYAETKQFIFFIEVKNWSESFYWSKDEARQKKEMLQQQFDRKAKIEKEFSSSKKVIYLISFPTGEIANDFQKFLTREEAEDLLVVHHDKVHTKTWEAEYNIWRVDKLIELREKKMKSNNKKDKTKNIINP